MRLITEKIWYFILWKSSSNHIYNQYPPLNWQYPPSLGNPQAFDHRLCPRDGKFEPYLAGLGDLNLKYLKSFQHNSSVVSLHMEVIKVNSSLSQTNDSEEKVYKVKSSKCGKCAENKGC